MRLIDADELLRRYDEEHEGPPGKARKLIEEAKTIQPEDALRIIADKIEEGRSDWWPQLTWISEMPKEEEHD